MRSPAAAAPPAGVSGMLVFAADGRLVAATTSGPWGSDVAIGTVAELESRYRQADGMPLDLRQPGRRVAIPVDGNGSRVVVASQPLQSTGGLDAALAVAVEAFGSESDPETIQRALGSVLAHELRTPLTTVYAGAELLLNAGLAEATRLEAAQSVIHAAERLHRVIEDLVVLVRWTGDRSDEEEPVLLQPIVRRVVRRIADQRVEVAIDAPPDVPSVSASPLVVEQILRNMIEHAVTNSPPGGRIVVSVHAAGDEVAVEVADDGPPRSDEERKQAFDLFAPTTRRGSDASGANLGLVAARRLVERLGGRIEAVRLERGGAVVVRLPATADLDTGEPL